MYKFKLNQEIERKNTMRELLQCTMNACAIGLLLGCSTTSEQATNHADPLAKTFYSPVSYYTDTLQNNGSISHRGVWHSQNLKQRACDGPHIVIYKTFEQRPYNEGPNKVIITKPTDECSNGKTLVKAVTRQKPK